MSSKFNSLLFFFLLLISSYSQGQNEDSLASFSIQVLDSIFHTQKDAEDYSNMIPYAETGAKKAKELYGKKDTCYARMLYHLAYAYDYSIEDYDQAITYYKQAIEIQKKSIPNSIDYSNTLLALADLYNHNLQKLDTAQTLYLEAAKIRKIAVGSYHPLYAETINNLGNLYRNNNQHDLAEKAYLQALKIRKAALGERHPYYITSLINLADLYAFIGRYEQAEKVFLTVLKIRKEVYGENHAYYAGSLHNLAFLYLNMGKYEQSEALYLKTIEIGEQTVGKEHPDYASSLNDLAMLYTLMDKPQEAEKLFLEAIKIRTKAFGEQHGATAASMYNLASLYERMGVYEQAEILHLKAIKIRKAYFGEIHPEYAASLHNLGGLYKIMGKFEQAEPLYLQTIEIDKKTLGQEHPYYATSLTNLASLYENMEKYKKAEELYRKAIKIREKTLGVKHPKYAQSLNYLAKLYIQTRKFEQAEPLSLEAIELEKEVLGEEHSSYAASLIVLASLYEGQERFEKANKLYIKANKIIKNILGNQHPEYALSLNDIARTYQFMDKYDTAFSYCMAGMAANSYNFESVFPNLFHSNDFSPNQCCHKLTPSDFLKLPELKYRSTYATNASLHELLYITKSQYTKLKKLNPSNKLTKEKLDIHYNMSKSAIKINEQIRNNFSGKKNKLRILKKHETFVKFAIDAAFELGKPINYEEAFSFAEQNKSILLADAVKNDRARSLGDLPDSLALIEITLQQRKESLKKLILEAKNEARKTQIITQENKLNAEIDHFIKSIKNKYPKYHALKHENITAKSSDIQALLDDKTLLVEYFVSKERTYLFAITKNEIQLFSIKIRQEALKKKIQALHHSLSDYRLISKQKNKAYELYTRNAHWFYKEMLAQVLKEKNITNLIVVADGELGHLPFEAFLTKDAPQSEINYKNLPYLVNDYNISYNYSTTLWKENLETRETINNQQMLACASAYPSVDSNLAHLREPTLFDLRTRLQALPAAQEEVALLSKSFSGDFLQEENANEAFFKKNAANYAIIHLAMHGILDPRTPMLSSLAFTENGDSLEDNFLQAYEIARLKLNANLVVLSACETGYGKFEQGEGIISLARSFMYAGTPSLVVSLWQVNDNSTANIMSSFYQNLIRGTDKASALRQAKLDYIKNASGIAAHPAFWSSFIQLGDSRPIIFTNKGAGIIAVSLLILIALGMSLLVTKIFKKLK